MEIFTAIQNRWAPSTIALNYFQQTYPSFSDFWLFRRQFSYQLAALTFMTYIMQMNCRYPHKLSISRSTGKVWGSELIPAIKTQRPEFHNPEPVPFRLTPNLQTLMGPLATEGVFAASLMAIARCLTEPSSGEQELGQQLSIFVRDEMIFWNTQQHKAPVTEQQLRELVGKNCGIVVNRAVVLARPPEAGSLPANQTAIDDIARATNPRELAHCDTLWMAYL